MVDTGIMSPSAPGASSVLSHIGFRSITLEGLYQFNSNFTERSSIIKYSLKRGVILKILTELWPFFNLYFG